MNSTPRTDDAQRRVAFGVVLRGSVPPTVLSGGLAALVLALVRGPGGGLSALVGVVIAVAFFASGLLVMARIVDDTGNPLLFMAVGMATYFAQVIALFGVIVASGQVKAFDTVAAGIAILVCVVMWQVAQIRAWRRARLPIYDDVRLPGDAFVDPVAGSAP